MKLPISWLNEYVQTDLTPQQLSDKLLGCGFEVEEIIYLGKDIQNVVCGKIIKTERHPDADRLIICQTDIGKDVPLQVVTGADNIKVGDIVPVATEGAQLPYGIKIKAGKLRGIMSYGMLCSGEELKIDDTTYEGASTDGILIIKEDVKCGTDIKKALCLDEYILDVSVTANRPDCQSIYGMAREVAALLNKPIKPLNVHFEQNNNYDINENLTVSVLSPQLCPRYIATCVKNVKITQSPQWIKKRLRLCGIRPINIIVDITNYILLELGQPMHAFDARHIEGNAIIVRNAHNKEKIITLDGTENNLTEDMLVICDKYKPVALAGIMGGENSGIADDTKQIIFEAAKFARDSIRKTSKKLSIRSDSSARFEKGVDAYTCGLASKRALALVYQTKCGDIVSGNIDVLNEDITDKTIVTEKKNIDNLLGISIQKEHITDILSRLNFNVRFECEKLYCTVPPYREDIESYPDLAEEIIRFYGYDHIESTLFSGAVVMHGGKSVEQQSIDQIKNNIIAQGFNEIITYSFIDINAYDKLNIDKSDSMRNSLKLRNPLSEKLSIIKTTLIYNMIETMQYNINNKNTAARLFETGSVYIPESSAELPYENTRICMGCYGEGEDFFSLKGAVETVFDINGINAEFVRGNYAFLHDGICADIIADGKKAGYIGCVHPDVLENFDIKQKLYICEIDFDTIKPLIYGFKGYKNIARYPQIDRDLAVVVSEEITCAQIIDTIKSSAGALLKNIELFDYYKGGQVEKGHVSMAFSLKIGDDGKTLKVEDADGIIQKILKQLNKKYSAKLR